jgi:hypothetical protein
MRRRPCVQFSVVVSRALLSFAVDRVVSSLTVVVAFFRLCRRFF